LWSGNVEGRSRSYRLSALAKGWGISSGLETRENGNLAGAQWLPLSSGSRRGLGNLDDRLP